MKSRQDTRKRILDAAAELLQHNGFSGFSYQHIARRLGVKNATIHYHFPAKTDLGVAVIRRYRSNFAWWAEQLDRRQSGPAARLEAFFDLETRYLREGKVCPLGVVGVEYAAIPDPMRRETEAFVGELLAWMGRTLRAGAEKGELVFREAPDNRALNLMAALQGGLQLARVGGERAFGQILDGLRADVGLDPQGARPGIGTAV